jgi:hypothetical protein
MRMHQPQVSIVHNNHFIIVTWFSTHIIVHCLKEAISEEAFFSSRFNILFSRKTLQSNLSWLHKALSSSVTLKERLSGDRLSLTSELVKSPFLDLGFTSPSELEDASLKKLKSLKAAHAQDMIF